MMYDFLQNTNTLYPSYEDEGYWRYLLEEAEWYGKQEDMEDSFQQNKHDEKNTGLDKIIR